MEDFDSYVANPSGGWLMCSVCGASQPVGDVRRLLEGSPKCCEETMTISDSRSSFPLRNNDWNRRDRARVEEID